MNSLLTRLTRRKRVVIAVAAVALLGAAGVFSTSRSGLQAKTAASPAASPAPKVTVATVEEKVLSQYTDLIGRVEPVEAVEIRPRVAGHIAAVHFQSGQTVKAGDLLFTIDPRYYRAAVQAAEAAVQQARVRVTTATREAARADRLLAERAISQEDAETRQSRAEEAKAALASAEAALASTRLDLEHTEVRAPIAGRVSRAYVTTGNLISGSAQSGTLLTTVVSQEKAYVYATLDETTVLQFHRAGREGRLGSQGDTIPVEMQLSDEVGFPRRGQVESVDNRLDAATGSLIVRMVFDNSDGSLVPGLFARVRVPLAAPSPTLLISERAVGTDQNQKYVLALAPDQTVTYRAVKLGPTLHGKRVVREGLRSGEKIVVNGLQRVRPGMAVTAELAAESDAGVVNVATR